MARRILLLFVLLISGLVAAQESRLLILGKIISSKDSSAMQGVIVSCKSPARQANSDSKGHYAILLDFKAGSTLEYRILGYKTVSKTITPSLLKRAVGDTLHLDIVMQPEQITLKEFTIRSGPDTVIGDWHFFIEDYEFYNDTSLILLTFEKSLNRAKVMLADINERIIASADVPVEAISLYKDYQGHINVMCKDSAFRVKIVPPSRLLLLALPYQDFCERIIPCIDTIGGKILFSNYHTDYPAFSYFAYDPQDTTIDLIHYLVDKDLLSLYDWEFDYLKPKDRLYARKMEAYTGIDKRVIAATMTGFPKSIYYTPLFAPLFVVHDTVCVFDHYSDSLLLYNKKDEPIGGSHIDYHRPKNWKDWDRKMYKDEVTGEMYAQFEHDGIMTLKKIDIATGKVVGEFRIANKYVKQIHIRNGYVYYIYRPYESVQKKYLYRERIVF